MIYAELTFRACTYSFTSGVSSTSVLPCQLLTYCSAHAVIALIHRSPVVRLLIERNSSQSSMVGSPASVSLALASARAICERLVIGALSCAFSR